MSRILRFLRRKDRFSFVPPASSLLVGLRVPLVWTQRSTPGPHFGLFFACAHFSQTHGRAVVACYTVRSACALPLSTFISYPLPRLCAQRHYLSRLYLRFSLDYLVVPHHAPLRSLHLQLAKLVPRVSFVLVQFWYVSLTFSFAPCLQVAAASQDDLARAHPNPYFCDTCFVLFLTSCLDLCAGVVPSRDTVSLSVSLAVRSSYLLVRRFRRITLYDRTPYSGPRLPVHSLMYLNSVFCAIDITQI